MILKIANPIPYDLLLLADPSMEQIQAYLPFGKCYTAFVDHTLVGVLVLLPLEYGKIEIKNIAVKPKLQGRGYGKQLLGQATVLAKAENYKSIVIGTANSSIGQLALYQKEGFNIESILFNFFTENYTEPIYENGIQAKHMVILEKKL